MQIIVIGNSKVAKTVVENFCKNKANIVFAFFDCEGANKININPKNTEELKDFISANDVSLCVVADKNLTDIDFDDIINETECSVFCPDKASDRICTNITSGKKFAYKNKVQTSKFAAFEKPAAAIEYVTTANFPLVIMPDKANDLEPSFIAETKEKARGQIEQLFRTGNKKILIEDYIQGTEYTKYIITDGCFALDFADIISYFDECATNNTNYISKNVREQIKNEIVPNLFNAFMEEEIRYCGILGLKFIIDKNEKIYFEKFQSFFDEIDVEIAVQDVEEDLTDLFYSCATGNLFDKYEEIKKGSKYILSTEIENQILTFSANTMSKAIELALFNGANEKALKEAVKLWKR